MFHECRVAPHQHSVDLFHFFSLFSLDICNVQTLSVFNSFACTMHIFMVGFAPMFCPCHCLRETAECQRILQTNFKPKFFEFSCPFEHCSQTKNTTKNQNRKIYAISLILNLLCVYLLVASCNQRSL